MRKFLLVFLLLFSLVVPADAATQFVEDGRFDPEKASSYLWRTDSDGNNYVYFSANNYTRTYSVYDYGDKWGVYWSRGEAYMCAPNVSWRDCMPLSTTVIAKNQINFPQGYYFLFGVEAEVEDPPPPVEVPTVSISPDSGEFTDFLDVIVSGSSGATLYYSLDGSEPSIPYAGTIRITESTTLRAKAVNSAGSSPVVSKSYTKKVVALSLIISPDTSVLDKPLQVSLIPSEPGGTVYYSLDGSEPSRPYTGAITVDRPLTLKAKFVKDGRSSPVYQKVYKKAPIMHTDEKFFQVPVDMPAIVTGATDYISVASPGVWLFAVSFLGLLILGIVKKVFRK